MIEKVKELMIGKTIEKVEFESYQAPNDIMILRLNDNTSIKIMSDPTMCFNGLAFYIKKKKIVEVEEDEEVK